MNQPLNSNRAEDTDKISNNKIKDSKDGKEYSTPKLVLYGDLRDITLGGSPGIGESGNPTSYKT